MANGQLNIRTVKLGDSATPANNFLITTPAVADGSLSIQTESGVPVLTRTATGKIVVGAEQTWQNVSGSRAVGTTYTNSTGQTIDVSVGITSTATNHRPVITMGNGVYVSGGTQAVAASLSSIYARIPSGETYTVTCSSGTASISIWAELR